MFFERAWILWLAVPLIAALLLAASLRARRTKIVVPSVIPWEHARDSARSGAKRRNLPAILALQILFVLFALTAASGPMLKVADRGLPGLIVILDRTASMKAPGSGGASRMDEAKAAASSALRGLAGTTPATLRCVPPLDSGDVRLPAAELAALINTIEATDVPGNVQEAVAASAAVESAVLAVTDDLRGFHRLEKGVLVVSVGSRVNNAGISWVHAARGEPGFVVPFVRVFNASDSPLELAVETAVSGRVRSVRSARIGPWAETGVTLDPVAAGEDVDSIEIRADARDAFPADDRAWLARGAQRKLSVAVSGADSPDLVRALEALGDADVSIMPPDAAPGGVDVVAWVRKPPAQPLSSRALVIDPPGAFLGLEIEKHAGPHPDLKLSPWLEKECPGLASVPFSSWVSVAEPPEGCEVACSVGGKAVVFGAWSAGFPYWFVGLPADRGRSDWRRTPWFPIFWKAVFSRLWGEAGQGDFVWTRAGKTVGIPGLAGALPNVTGPDGAAVRVFTDARRFTFIPVLAGLYSVSDRAGGTSRQVAVNIADRAESDLGGSSGSMGALPGPGEADSLPGGVGLADLAAASALAALIALLIADLGIRRRKSPVAAILLLIAAAAAQGCGSSGKNDNADKPDLRPGQPLPAVAEPRTAAARVCPSCGEKAGEGHACGKSRFCAGCEREASIVDHVCGMSAFCPKCGQESALTGHRCGRTRFCPLCKAEVPAVHKHN